MRARVAAMQRVEVLIDGLDELVAEPEPSPQRWWP
jgi:hypothetical protein